MRLFLDTSVLLAASASSKGASREILLNAAANGWVLVATPYVIEEVYRNLPDMAPNATADWARLRPLLVVMDDVVTLDRPAVFEPAKDRPILFSALAWADALLTLDRADFGSLMDTTFYGLRVLRPGLFLKQERDAGRIV